MNQVVQESTCCKAVGEILHVMIGILLALQVNNWNEWRKDRVQEKEVLEDLKENLERNIIEIEESLNILTSYDNSASIVLDFIQGKLPYSDTLRKHFFFSRFNGSIFLNISYDGYESLKSDGFKILCSDFLRDNIVNLFESNYKSMAKISSYQMQNLSNHDPYILNNFIQHKGADLEPINPIELKKDIAYYSLLNRVEEERGFLRFTQNGSLKETQRVLQLIKDELNKSE